MRFAKRLASVFGSKPFLFLKPVFLARIYYTINSMMKLRGNKGQSISSEYVLVFFLVVSMMTAMTIYFRRVIQARIKDARFSMVDTVRDRTLDLYSGNTLLRIYEPYYIDTTSNTRTQIEDVERLTTAGQYEKNYSELRWMQSVANTASPQEGQ